MIPWCEIVIVLSVTLKSRVCICTLIRDGVDTPYRLLCGANNHTVCTTLCIHYTCGKLKLSCELCWKLAERAHCPETRTSCLQFATLCLDILSRPICKDGHPWAAARFLWIIGRSLSLQPQTQPQPGIHTWWLRSCKHFQPPKKYCDVSDKFYIAFSRQLNFKKTELSAKFWWSRKT